MRVWNAATGQDILTLKGHTARVWAVAYSPDGRCLASAGWDGTVKVWDAATGQETLSLKGHRGAVNGVAFSPDGRRLASASSDQTVRVWDAATGQAKSEGKKGKDLQGGDRIGDTPGGSRCSRLSGSCL